MMSSKLTLKNNLDTEFTIEHSDNASAKSIKGKDIAVSVDTINDFPVVASNGDVVIVRNAGIYIRISGVWTNKASWS